jgi:hypothetical protein
MERPCLSTCFIPETTQQIYIKFGIVVLHQKLFVVFHFVSRWSNVILTLRESQIYLFKVGKRGSSVSTVNRLRARRPEFKSRQWQRWSHRFQTGSGAHPASCPMGTWGSYPRSRTTGSWSWPLTPSSAEVNNARSYASTPQYVFIAWCLIK